jgi:hypothetical protein
VLPLFSFVGKRQDCQTFTLFNFQSPVERLCSSICCRIYSGVYNSCIVAVLDVPSWLVHIWVSIFCNSKTCMTLSDDEIRLHIQWEGSRAVFPHWGWNSWNLEFPLQVEFNLQEVSGSVPGCYGRIRNEKSMCFDTAPLFVQIFAAPVWVGTCWECGEPTILRVWREFRG